jgi:hypothetical protein
MGAATYIGTAQDEAIQEEMEEGQSFFGDAESSKSGQGPLTGLGNRAPELKSLVQSFLDREIERHDAAVRRNGSNRQCVVGAKKTKCFLDLADVLTRAR